MNRSGLTYIIALVVAFFIIILVIFGAIKILTGGSSGGSTTPPPAPTTTKKLTDYVDNGQVTFTIDGHINGEDLHKAIRITIDHNRRQLDVLAGYNEDVASHNEQGNSEQAFDIFLRALNNSGFLLKLKNTKVSDDERGQCPTGTRYSFDLKDTDTGDQVSHLWTSSCGTSVGTLGGQFGTLQELFEDQITNYNTLTNSVVL